MKLICVTMLCVVAGFAADLGAHPFDDRADMITHLSVTGERQLEISVFYYFSTVPASYIEAAFKLDADKNGTVTVAERDKRLGELALDRLDNMDLQANGKRLKLVVDPTKYQCIDLANPDNDFSSADGFKSERVRLGYALGFTAEIVEEPVDGAYAATFTFVNKSEKIDDPETQIRAFDERVQPRKSIDDIVYDRRSDGPFVVTFHFKAAAKAVALPDQPKPAEPKPVEPDASARKQLTEMSEKPRMDKNNEGFFKNLFTALREGGGDIWYWVTALAFVFGWGAWHALQPGHGKTLVAGYLIGTQGRKSDALFLGAVVTLAHTSGVLLLLGGMVTLREFWPDTFDDPTKSLSEWITVAVGATIVLMGAGLLLKRAGGAPEHKHDVFGRHVDGEEHGHDHPHEADQKFMSRWEILRLGVLGGVIPCPAAFVIALISIEQRLFVAGLMLVVVFSLGLALVLSTIGLIMVATKGYMRARGERKTPFYRFMETKVPVIGALAITLIGFTMLLMALLRLQILDISTFTA